MSSSSFSFSPARYVPPGPSSLSSDAPGYYCDDDQHNCVGGGRSEPAGDDGKGAGAAALPAREQGKAAGGDEGRGAGGRSDDVARAESKNEMAKQAADDGGSPPTSSSPTTTTTMLGPACWKCKGTGVVAPKKKKKKKRAKKKAKKKKRRLATTTSNNDQAEEEEINAAKPDSSDNDAPCEEETDSGGAIGIRCCPVCRGAGRLPVRSKWRTSQEHMPGCVTSRRKRPTGWTPGGPVPPALVAALAWNDAATRNHRRREEEEGDVVAGGEKEGGGKGADLATERYALRCLLDAEGVDNCNGEGGEDAGSPPRDVPILLPTNNNPTTLGDTPTARPVLPKWLPVHRGEQLCNLVGRWRIVQRLGSHRWTTDDLVTAYVAGRFIVAGGAARGGEMASSSQTLLPKATTTTTATTATTTTTTLRYLDLGTGNGSVLQMVSWYALKAWGVNGSATATVTATAATHPLRQLDAVGVEARCEAVQLARRSLAFNVGDDGDDEMGEDQGESGHRRFYDVDGDRRSGGDGTNDDGVDSCRRTVEANIDVVRGDFRDLVDLSERATEAAQAHDAPSSSGAARNGAEEDEPSRERRRLERVARRTYDLITGTPPYFRVDFGIASSSETAGDADGGVVKSAVIRQGGMPTSIQSAPARCEFRGGIEAYCRTASALLRPPPDCDGDGDGDGKGDDDGGVFVVCENWLNDQRAYDGAAAAGLEVMEVFPVKGREGRKENLFAVYVMRLRRRRRTTKDGGKGRDAVVDGSGTDGDGGRGTAVVHPPLVVRDAGGRWTAAYADVLEDMSIPARHTVAPPTTK